MIKVFVSGCYDIVHGGHVEFFKQARELGDYLIVSFASDEVLRKYKGRLSALPEKHKKYLLESIRYVDEVYPSSNTDDYVLDFKDTFLRIKPNILAVTDDDKYAEKKKALCAQVGAKYVVLPKSLAFEKISTTQLRDRICQKDENNLKK